MCLLRRRNVLWVRLQIGARFTQHMSEEEFGVEHAIVGGWRALATGLRRTDVAIASAVVGRRGASVGRIARSGSVKLVRCGRYAGAAICPRFRMTRGPSFGKATCPPG